MDSNNISPLFWVGFAFYMIAFIIGLGLLVRKFVSNPIGYVNLAERKAFVLHA